MVYYGLLLVLAGFSPLKQIGIGRELSRRLFWIGCVMIFVVGGFRQNVGTDWPSYQELFASLDGIPDVFAAREEKLFLLLMLGSKRLIESYEAFVVLAFGIAFVSKAVVIQRYSLDCSLSLLVYVYTVLMIYDMNGLRYGLALACILVAIPSILQRRLGLFLLLCAIAAGFHLSALVAVPFYWLSRVKLSARVVGGVTLLTLAAAVGVRSVLERGLAEWFTSSQALEHYLFFLKDVGSGESVALVSVAGLQRVVTLVLALWVMRGVEGRDDVQRLLLNGYALSLVLFVLFSFSGEFATRMSYYFKAMEILLIPEIVSSQRSKVVRVVLVAFFAGSGAIAVSRLLSIPDGNLVPYRSMLEGAIGP